MLTTDPSLRHSAVLETTQKGLGSSRQMIRFSGPLRARGSLQSRFPVPSVNPANVGGPDGSRLGFLSVLIKLVIGVSPLLSKTRAGTAQGDLEALLRRLAEEARWRRSAPGVGRG